MLHERLYSAARGLLKLGPEERRAVVGCLRPEDAAVIHHAIGTDWLGTWARPKQIIPAGDWRWLLMLAGRNWGKTLSGAQAVREWAETGAHEWVSIVGPTFQNVVRDQLTGPSGVLTISPKWFRPEYNAGRSELRWPRHPITGIQTRASLLSADRPDRIRGSRASRAWLDETASWTKPQEAFEMIDLTLSLGADPRGIITTTPRTNRFTRDLVLGARGDDGKRRGPRPDLLIVTGRTAENLRISRAAYASLQEQYAGTTIGRQELEAEVLAAPESALWTREIFDKFREQGIPSTAQIKRRIVSIDPTRSATGGGDVCGIVTMALAADGHVYLLADDSLRGSPLMWAKKAAQAAHHVAADEIIYEGNRLDSGIVNVINQVAGSSGTKWRAIKAVGTKDVRAQPAAALYEAGRVHHVGAFDALEEEMAGWDPTVPSHSPDRLDAVVHGLAELCGGAPPPVIAAPRGVGYSPSAWRIE